VCICFLPEFEIQQLMLLFFLQDAAKNIYADTIRQNLQDSIIIFTGCCQEYICRYNSSKSARFNNGFISNSIYVAHR
jgi:hypothetical protein